MYLLVDGNRLAYAIRFTQMWELATSDGRRSGVIYGVLRNLKTVLRTQGILPCYAVVVWDGGHAEWRKDLYPEYKLREPKTDEDRAEQQELFHQISILEKALPDFGVRSVRVRGCEADDVISVFSSFYVSRGYQTLIYSSDKDFHQLVSENVWVLTPDMNILGPEEIEKRWGVKPGDGLLFRRCIWGDDSSDNIKGVPGLGEKRSLLLARWYEGGCKPAKDCALAKLIEKAAEHADIVQRNWALMRLPRTWDESGYSREQAADAMTQLANEPTRNNERIRQFCDEWEIDTLPDTDPAKVTDAAEEDFL